MGCSYKISVFKRPYLAANMFKAQWLSFCFSEHPSQSLYNFNAHPVKQRRKCHRNGMTSLWVQNFTKSVILNRITFRYPLKKSIGKEILYIKLPTLVASLFCDGLHGKVLLKNICWMNKLISACQDYKSLSYWFLHLFLQVLMIITLF